MTDWRSDKDLFTDIMMNTLPPGQAHWKKDKQAAIEDDQKNRRGHLILNPDLDTQGIDVEGLIIGRPGEEHEGEEYRVIFDPALKGMKDLETGEIRAGFWLKPQPPIDFLSPIIESPFAKKSLGDEWSNPEPQVFVAPPQMALFDVSDDEDDNGNPQRGIPGIATDDYPQWYRPSKDRKEANMRVLQGRHPMGHALGPEDKTCGDCEHMVGREFSKTYWKCRKSKQSGGPATDIRKKWRACEQFESAGFKHLRFSPSAIMAMPEKAELVSDIEDAMYRRCYKAWMEYYEKSENLDRIHPHHPARKGFREVTTAGINKSDSYRKALKEIRVVRDKLCSVADREIENRARKDADMEFTRDLEHCECDQCRRAR